MSKKIKLSKALGKTVVWEYARDPKRGTYFEDEGVVTGVKGRNIEIDGVWHWVPDLHNLRVK